MKKLNNPATSLGEKVALIDALSSYYEWNENPKGKFESYQKAYFDYLKKNKIENLAFNNESIAPEIRLIWVLMNDYDTSSPNVKAYQWLAKKMPKSLTAQTISVIAYAYHILYNDDNEFKTMRDLKQNHLKPYFENLNSFDLDAPIEVKVSAVDALLPYALDCEGRLKCLVDTSSEQTSINGLNELSGTIKKNIELGIPVSDSYSAKWIDTKEVALEWINVQEKYINKTPATDIQKAKMRYFFNNKLYELMHNIDYISIRLYESSFMDELNPSKAKCKTDAHCAATLYLKKISSDLEKKGIAKKDLDLLTSTKDSYKTAFENVANDFGMDAAVGASDDEPMLVFESAFDTLHFLMIYLYQNPEKITQMYNME